MILDENHTHYDTLEVSPDASPTEIRESYLRLKSAYSKGSVALYTLMDREETEQMLHRIEEAYHVLSSKEKRRDYDRNHGLLSIEGEIEDSFRPMPQAKIISIDRVPPMDRNSSADDLLVAPVTDFTAPQFVSAQAAAPMTSTSADPENAETDDSPFSEASMPAEDSPAESTSPEAIQIQEENEVPPQAPASTPSAAPEAPDYSYAASAAQSRKAVSAIEYEIQHQTEWSGPFLRKVREARNVSPEEMAEFTKITRTYIRAIEEEDYQKLPAAVYLRGFVLQMAKKLRLPHDKVAAAYVARYRKNCPDKA